MEDKYTREGDKRFTLRIEKELFEELGYDFYECKTTGPEVARLAEASLYQGYRHKGLEEIDRNGDFMIARMIKLLILKHYEQPDGKINYKSEVNYRNLHNIIAFINNYYKDKKELLDKPKNKVKNTFWEFM